MVEDFDGSLGGNSLYFNLMTSGSCLDPYPDVPTLSIDFFVTHVGNIKCVQLINVVRVEILHVSL